MAKDPLRNWHFLIHPDSSVVSCVDQDEQNRILSPHRDLPELHHLWLCYFCHKQLSKSKFIQWINYTQLQISYSWCGCWIYLRRSSQPDTQWWDIFQNRQFTVECHCRSQERFNTNTSSQLWKAWLVRIITECLSKYVLSSEEWGYSFRSSLLLGFDLLPKVSREPMQHISQRWL